jgi:hypothetical protein
VLEEGAEPRESRGERVGVDGCREVAADDEVRAFAAADLVGDDAADDRRVLVIADVEPASASGTVSDGSVDSSAARSSVTCSSTTRQRSGAPSSWHAKPRSTTWR